MGRRIGMNDQGLHVSDVRQKREELQMVDEGEGLLLATLDLESENRSTAVREVLLVEGVVRMVRQRRMVDVLIDIAVICATAYLVRYGYALAMRKMMVPMMVLPIKAGVQYMAFPAGMACTLFFLIDQLFADIRDSVKGEERLCG